MGVTRRAPAAEAGSPVPSRFGLAYTWENNLNVRLVVLSWKRALVITKEPLGILPTVPETKMMFTAMFYFTLVHPLLVRYAGYMAMGHRDQHGS